MKRISEKWKSLSSVQLFVTPWTIYSPWNSPGQNTGVGNCSVLQRIFLTQGSNPHCNADLPHCRRILYQLSHQGSPWKECISNKKRLYRDRKGAQQKSPLDWNAVQAFTNQICALNYPWSLARLNQGILSRKFFIYQARSRRHSTSGILGLPTRRQRASQELWQSERTHSFKRRGGDRGTGGEAGYSPDWELTREPNPSPSNFLLSLLDSGRPRRSTAPRVQEHQGTDHKSQAGSHGTLDHFPDCRLHNQGTLLSVELPIHPPAHPT